VATRERGATKARLGRCLRGSEGTGYEVDSLSVYEGRFLSGYEVATIGIRGAGLSGYEGRFIGMRGALLSGYEGRVIWLCNDFSPDFQRLTLQAIFL
jgi:hypothetical protein